KGRWQEDLCPAGVRPDFAWRNGTVLWLRVGFAKGLLKCAGSVALGFQGNELRKASACLDDVAAGQELADVVGQNLSVVFLRRPNGASSPACLRVLPGSMVELDEPEAFLGGQGRAGEGAFKQLDRLRLPACLHAEHPSPRPFIRCPGRSP